METDSLSSAMDRLAVALDRIEAVRPPRDDSETRHARLRQEVQRAVAALDELIEPEDG